MRRWINGIMFLLIISLSFFIPKHVNAKVNRPELSDEKPTSIEKSCYSLDVVFLIDQSESMSSIRASDPEKERQLAVTSMIDLLIDNALDFCPDAYHRVAVISYGSEAQIDMDLSSINPDSEEEAEAIRKDLKPKVQLLNLGETQPKKAFKKAFDIFNRSLEPPSGGLRKKVIIFVSDGIPYDSSLEYMDFMQYVREMRTEIDNMFPFKDEKLREDAVCWQTLQQKYSKINKASADERAECLRILKDHDVKTALAENTYIYGLFLESPTPYPKEMISVYRDLVESHAGQLLLLKKDPAEIPGSFRKIIEQLIGVEASVLDCGDFAVNPYLDKMILTFYKMSGKFDVILSYIDEKGETHTISGGKDNGTGGFILIDYDGKGTPNERYSIAHPFPGIWKLNADYCEGLDAYFESVEIADPSLGDKTKLPAEGIPQYDRPPYHSDRNEEKYYIRYQMLDAAAEPILNAPLPEFQVDVDVKITDPSGEITTYPMKWEDGLFVSESPIMTPLAGIYSLDIIGNYRVRNAEPLIPRGSSTEIMDVFPDIRELFSLKGKTFKAFPVTPFVLQITGPEVNGGVLTPLHGTILDKPHWPLPPVDIPATVVFTHRDGSPVAPGDLGKLLKSPGSAMTINFILPSGNSQSKLMELDPATGEYSGVLEGVDLPGKYTISAELTGELSKDYRPDKFIVESSFDRQEGNIWHKSNPYRVMFGLLLGLILIAIARFFIIRSNKIRGDLIFTDGSTEIARFGLYSGKNWTDFNARTLESYPMLDLKFIRVSRKGRAKEKVTDDGITGSNYYSGDTGECAQAGIRTRDGRRATVDLFAGVPTSYSDNSVALMKYEPPIG